MKTFNINKRVKVKLKEEGLNYLVCQYNEMVKKHKLKSELKTIKDYKSQLDEDGYMDFQLWDFMMTFGPTTDIALEPMFDLDILFYDRDLN